MNRVVLDRVTTRYTHIHMVALSGSALRPGSTTDIAAPKILNACGYGRRIVVNIAGAMNFKRVD